MPRNPSFPIYIVSKGRHDTRLTSRTLEEMKVPYFIVVEQQERDLYAGVIDPKKVLVLDPQYQRDYDPFDDLGDTKGKGPGAARNFAWDHALSIGAPWHWVMDDNIKHFYRFNRNMKIPVADGTILRCMEDFCLRFKNVGMAGPNYFMFAPRKRGDAIPPFILNTRIYSCNLIRGDLPFRWRGRYNEDTDLSLRMLKASWCTVQFNAFLQGKMNTQTMKGGNTAEFYAREGTLAKSKMQVAMHPDISKVVWRFGRWHHYVNYRSFQKLVLIPRPDAGLPAGTDDYGLALRYTDDLAALAPREPTRFLVVAGQPGSGKSHTVAGLFERLTGRSPFDAKQARDSKVLACRCGRYAVAGRWQRGICAPGVDRLRTRRDFDEAVASLPGAIFLIDGLMGARAVSWRADAAVVKLQPDDQDRMLRLLARGSKAIARLMRTDDGIPRAAHVLGIIRSGSLNQVVDEAAKLSGLQPCRCLEKIEQPAQDLG